LKAVRNGVEVRYIYDANGNLLAEADSSNTITRYYVHGAGLLAAITPAGDLYCYHYDGVGNTVAITDASETVVNSYDYSPFGMILTESEIFAQPFKFVGKLGVMAEANGFYYMRARYYDPVVGRFISEDPLGFDGGDVNLYVYGSNNPLLVVDPWGMKLKVPSFSQVWPNSTMVAPIADIVLGSYETSQGIVSGIGAAVLTLSGPETWPIAAPLATATPALLFDGIKRINTGIAALGDRNSTTATAGNHSVSYNFAPATSSFNASVNHNSGK
jgi:RHS repeat-associated protein